MNTEYKHHSDAGHGWVEVPLQTLRALGVTPSHYSYQRADMAYLEEDGDLQAFVDAHLLHLGEIPKIVEGTHYEGDAPIRRFARF